MPSRAHVEEYIAVVSEPNQSRQTGFRIKEVKYWKVVEENIYTEYRKDLVTGLNTWYAAKCFADGWNMYHDAQIVERESA